MKRLRQRGGPHVRCLRGLALILALCGCGEAPLHAAAQQGPGAKDPAAWGRDFAGQPLPELVEGGQCLFCHREPVASKWSTDRHNKTMRVIEEAPEARAALEAQAGNAIAAEARWVLGSARRLRYLKPGQAYGTADMLPAGYDPATKQLTPGDLAWDPNAFAASCAGCHATGFDNASRSFMSPALDCVVCHGDLPLEHTTDPARALFSKHGETPPERVISVCGSCHLRTGKSRSTGRPFANNFLPGDNLFRDLDVDLSEPALRELHPIDRHILENVRDVALRGETSLTCLSCHAVHLRSTVRHRKLATAPSCFVCHKGDDLRSGVVPMTASSALCGY
jgi:hypothetical protein